MTHPTHKDMFLKGLYRTGSSSEIERRPTISRNDEGDGHKSQKMVIGKEDNTVRSRGSSQAGSFLWRSRGHVFQGGSVGEAEVDHCNPIPTDTVGIRRKFNVERLSLPHIEGASTGGSWQFDPKMLRRKPDEIFKDRLRRILQSYPVWAIVVALAVINLVLFILLQLGSLEGYESQVYVVQILFHSVLMLEMFIRLYADGLSYFSTWHDVLDRYHR